MNVRQNILTLDTANIENWDVDKFLSLYQNQGKAVIDSQPKYPTRAYVDWTEQYKHCAYCNNHRAGEEECKSCGANQFVYKQRRV